MSTFSCIPGRLLTGFLNRADNQPEFMQNLGLVPNIDMSQFYSHSDQAEPFNSTQTQQLPYPESTSNPLYMRQRTGDPAG